MAVAHTSCAGLDALLDALLPSPSALSDNSLRIVSARLPPKPRTAILAKSPDTRRNLYVLGLPFDLSLWVSHLVSGIVFNDRAGPSYRPSFLISVL
jgi:hypothetical protein